jgi:phosphotransferase system enzyme I (PtsP)
MLNTLRKIVQEVNSAKDLKAALGIIVLRVKEAMGSQVCSVYLLDPETNRFVLMATEGLNKRSIGKVSMAPNEGLVGLVGTREEPLNLENAADHPRYRYFAETGEERYASFLGHRSSTTAASSACWSSSKKNAASSTKVKKPSS